MFSWYVAHTFSERLWNSPSRPCYIGITFVFTFHMRCISIVRSLYFRTILASFLIRFLSPEIATSIVIILIIIIIIIIIVRSLYFRIFSASFLIRFLSPEIAMSIIIIIIIIIVRSLYFRIFSASFLIRFLSPEIATSTIIIIPPWDPQTSFETSRNYISKYVQGLPSLVPHLYKTNYSENHSLLVCEFPVVWSKFIDVSEQPAPAIYNSICPGDRCSSSLRHRIFPSTPLTGEKNLKANLATNVHDNLAPTFAISPQMSSKYPHISLRYSRNKLQDNFKTNQAQAMEMRFIHSLFTKRQKANHCSPVGIIFQDTRHGD